MMFSPPYIFPLSGYGAEVTKSLFNCCCDALYCFSYGLLYPRLYLDIICKRDRNCIDYYLQYYLYI
ncbi:uncharacterized protein DS421_16g550720 [Arachis hypogaea]|nr:uncharacterized protein DS421_16g550720 [Arachis hypogaea]